MRRSSVTISSDSRPFRFYGVQPRRLGTHSETLKCTVCALAGKRRTMHQFLLALELLESARHDANHHVLVSRKTLQWLPIPILGSSVLDISQLPH